MPASGPGAPPFIVSRPTPPINWSTPSSPKIVSFPPVLRAAAEEVVVPEPADRVLDVRADGVTLVDLAIIGKSRPREPDRHVLEPRRIRHGVVGPSAARDLVRAGPSIEQVGAGPAEESVIAGPAGEDVEQAGVAPQRVRPASALEDVYALPP